MCATGAKQMRIAAVHVSLSGDTRRNIVMLQKGHSSSARWQVCLYFMSIPGI
jgi:hypothetical protein